MSTDTRKNFTLWYRASASHDAGRMYGEYKDPADAVDTAEDRIHSDGEIVEVRFNGDPVPHTVVTQVDGRYAYWNNPNAVWPVFAIDWLMGAFMLDENPLPAAGGEDEISADGTDEQSKANEIEDEADDDGDDESESDDDEGEGKGEMPRLNIFAKMRGPKGWRKRAESDEDKYQNVFGLKIGVLDPDADTVGLQERDRRVEVKFTEKDDTRDKGELVVTLPVGCEFIQTGKKGNRWVAMVPYVDEDES